MQQSILLHVNQVKRTPAPKADSRHFEERFYTTLIEGVCKYALKSQSVYLFNLMPQLLHAGFVTPKTKDAISKSLEALTVPKEEPNLGSPIKHDASPKKATLSAKEIFLIRQCIEAVKTKWQDKSQIKSENVAAPQFIVKDEEAIEKVEEHAMEPAEEQEIIIDTSSRRQPQGEPQGDVAAQIGQKRQKPSTKEAENN